MRTWGLALLGILFLQPICYGQSTLTFPRVMQPQDFQTSGFALINPVATNAIVTFTLYGADGTIPGTVPQIIPARGQLSRLASELFPSAAGAGWIQVTSPSSGLQGFWLAGDLVTYGDGAEAATSSTALVLPLITPFSEIDIVNTGSGDATLLLDLLGTDGFDLALPLPERIPAKGYLKADMMTLFPALDDYSLPSHMRITCKCANANPFAATVVARDFLAAPSWAVRNAVPATSTGTTIYFPQLAEGPQGAANWRSLIGLTNLSTTTSNDVVMTFTSESGAIVRATQQTLPANGGLRFVARDLFGLTSGFVNGWVRVTSTSGIPFTGYIAYAETNAAGVAVVPPQQDPQGSLLFEHIADLPPWLTGLALLNTNTTAADIKVFALNPNGSLIGTTSLSLQPHSSAARLLRDLIPQTQTRASDGGFVFVQSSVPIYGIELFFSRSLQVLANVAAAPGNGFVPPSQ